MVHDTCTGSRRHCAKPRCPRNCRRGPSVRCGETAEIVDLGERRALKAWHGDCEDGRSQFSPVQFSSLRQCTLLRFAVEKERPTGLEARAGVCRWRAGVREGKAGCLGTLAHVPLCRAVAWVRPRSKVLVHPAAREQAPLPSTTGGRRTASSGRPPPPFSCACHLPVICLCSHGLISSQCQSHCVSYHSGHKTLVYNLKTSNIFSLRPPLLVLG